MRKLVKITRLIFICFPLYIKVNDTSRRRVIYKKRTDTFPRQMANNFAFSITYNFIFRSMNINNNNFPTSTVIFRLGYDTFDCSVEIMGKFSKNRPVPPNNHTHFSTIKYLKSKCVRLGKIKNPLANLQLQWSDIFVLYYIKKPKDGRRLATSDDYDNSIVKRMDRKFSVMWSSLSKIYVGVSHFYYKNFTQ